MFTGVYDLPWWGYVVYTLVVTHITIAAVTIYLHRHQAHRALDLHPLPSHFFRFWLWLTTGMITKEWTAIHRKHHAKCETVDDPHSPQIYGIRKAAAGRRRALPRRNRAIARRSSATATARPTTGSSASSTAASPCIGISLMLITNFVLFGFIGITIWAVQMMWIPFLAAGVINGIGHYWGYRNFPAERREPQHRAVGHPDRRRGAAQQPPRLRDLGAAFEPLVRVRHRLALHPRCCETLGLADVKKVAPRLKLDTAKTHCDLATLQAVVTHRYEVLAKYAKSLRTTCADEMRALRASAVSVDRARAQALAAHRHEHAPADRSASSASACSRRAAGSRPCTRCATSSRRCGSARPRRRNSSCTSSKTGAGAPKRAASKRCRTSPAACAATPDGVAYAATKKPAHAGFL